VNGTSIKDPVRTELPRRGSFWPAAKPRLALFGLLLAGLVALGYVRIDPAAMLASRANAVNFFNRVGALSFPGATDLLYQTALTLGIVLLGTLLAGVLSVPVAFLAARNTAPGRSAQVIGRAIGVLARATPDVVLAMVFALMFSLGALPGIMAIGLHSVGMISRLFADAIEQIDSGPRLAVRACGAGRLQELTAGVLPQVMPSWLATTLHRADINLRGSVILGYVGVPGLGMEMRNAFGALNYSRGLAIAVVIFGLCLGMEALSSTLRRRMLGAAPVKASRPAAARAAPTPSAAQCVVTRSAGQPSSTKSVAPDLGRYLERPWDGQRVKRLAGWCTAGFALAGALVVCQINLTDFVTVWSHLPPVLDKMWPPTAGAYGIWRLLGALMATVAVAFAAALMTLLASLIIGSLAARNVASRPSTRNFWRATLVVIRGIPELVLGIVLIVVTGLGAQAGTLALAFCHIGLLGKLMADSFEELPAGPQRALTAAGAGRLQMYVAGVLAPGRQAVVGHALYVLDTNIRAATLLGMVGGGGIGYYLLVAGQGSNYGQVTLIVAMIVAVVMALEGLTVWLRRTLA
jgi:phosphonate transport system permease protein